MRKPARIGIVFCELIVAFAVLFALRQIVVKIILYLAGLHGPDATLYFTMGNAIRNGLTIYGDIFDPKPPAIFFLSAASFALFNGGTLAFVLNVIVLLCIPVMFLWWGIIHVRSARAPHAAPLRNRFFVMQCSFIIGLTLALYHATIGGDVQTEFYGAFFGLLWLVAVDRDQRRQSALNVILASVTFALAPLFKEPFLLTLFAAALLLLRTRREWIRLFGIPLLSAGVLYLVTLTSLGALGSYVSVYLRSMFGNYIFSGGGPVWARGLVAWERMYMNVRDFSAWFPLLILALFLLSLPALTRRQKSLATATGAVLVSVLLLVRSYFPVQFPWHIESALAWILLGASCAPFFLLFSSSAFLPLVRRTWKHAVAVYLTLTAIGLGSAFHGQYFALALPVYAAMFLLVLQEIKKNHESRIMNHGTMSGVTVIAALILLSSRSFVPPGLTLAQMVSQIQAEEATNRLAAQNIDAILTACDIDRYYFLEDRGYMPYASHTPLNEYLYTRIEHIGRLHPVFFEESFRRLGEARVIVQSHPYVPAVKEGNAREACIGESVQAFVEERFTKQPWTCAKNLPPPAGYTMLFRKDPADESLPAFKNAECRQ